MDTMGEQFEESHRHLQDRVKKEIALLAGQLQTTESSLKVVHERQRESSAQLKKDVESALKGS